MTSLWGSFKVSCLGWVVMVNGLFHDCSAVGRRFPPVPHRRGRGQEVVRLWDDLMSHDVSSCTVNNSPTDSRTPPHSWSAEGRLRLMVSQLQTGAHQIFGDVQMSREKCVRLHVNPCVCVSFLLWMFMKHSLSCEPFFFFSFFGEILVPQFSSHFS